MIQVPQLSHDTQGGAGYMTASSTTTAGSVSGGLGSTFTVSNHVANNSIPSLWLRST
jgi:hypothetical protein